MDRHDSLDGRFGATHFGDCQLGDRRRTQRLVHLADRLLAHPDGTLPDKLQDPAAYLAACRLVNQPTVTHDAVLQPHYQLTRRTAAEHPGVVLFLADVTELDYSGHTVTALGQIGNGHGRGYECHHTLAVDPVTRRALGLAHQILHLRRQVPKGEGVRAKREHPQRESRLWCQAVTALGTPPTGCRHIDICDRGADIFEFLQTEAHLDRSYVVRSTHNRTLVWAPDAAEPHLLHDYLRQQPAQLGWTLAVAAQGRQPARTARLQACVVPVTVACPRVRRGRQSREPLAVWALRVWEVEAPPEVTEPLEWLLLTNVATEPASLRERVSWYECRPLVEEFHKSQKTGLGIEGLQFHSRAALEPLIGLYSVVAVQLLNLRLGARDRVQASQLAATVVPAVYVRVLSLWRYRQERALTVGEFTQALGRLGGHLNRKCDGLPGWLTLWRGWNKLHHMVQYELARATCDKP